MPRSTGGSGHRSDPAQRHQRTGVYYHSAGDKLQECQGEHSPSMLKARGQEIWYCRNCCSYMGAAHPAVVSLLAQGVA